jgi:deoxyribose-phosphate aldolase
MQAGDLPTAARADLAARIQHTLIEPGVPRAALERHCQECVAFGFHAAMVPGIWVALASRLLGGTGVVVASAVDFPLGAMRTAGKVAEAVALVEAGAGELDVGVPVGWLRSGMRREFRDDIAAVVEAAGVPVKVMLELPLLTAAERDLAVELAVDAGVAYVKNASSGAVGVATPADVRYLKQRVPASIGVKASGGIRTFGQAVALLEAGADLLGTSAGVAIVNGATAAVRSY